LPDHQKSVNAWIKTDNHVQLYDQEPSVPAAVEHVVTFLNSHLASRTTLASAA
jgi:fermentation-respiration switch protein FrsA (DUF1100 family)